VCATLNPGRVSGTDPAARASGNLRDNHRRAAVNGSAHRGPRGRFGSTANISTRQTYRARTSADASVPVRRLALWLPFNQACRHKHEGDSMSGKVWPILFLCGLSSLVGCRRVRNSRNLEVPATVGGDPNLVGPHTTIVEGCLTAADDRFVLTELRPGVPGPRVAARDGEPLAAAPRPTTETYRLVGMHDRLAPLVGRRVQVTGAAEPEKVVDIRESAPATAPRGAPTGTAGSAADSKVATQQSAHIDIHDLQVRSVAPTGDRCDAHE
jgi:hypothetical protein